MSVEKTQMDGGQILPDIGYFSFAAQHVHIMSFVSPNGLHSKASSYLLYATIAVFTLSLCAPKDWCDQTASSETVTGTHTNRT